MSTPYPQNPYAQQPDDGAPQPEQSYEQPAAQPYAQPAEQAYAQPSYEQNPYGQQQYAQQQYAQQQYAQQAYTQQQSYGYAQAPYAGTYTQKSKIVAGLLGILLGGIGVHNFYLGKSGRAIAQIVVTFITFGIGAIWGFIEGIIILVSQPGSPWHQDGNGIELLDS